MPIVPPGFCTVVVRTSRPGDPDEYNNVLAYELTGPVTQTDADDLSLEFATALDNILTTTMRYEGLRIAVGQDGGPPVIVESINGNRVGVIGASDTAPQNFGPLLRKTTAAGGRKNRGRLYWPCQPESSVSNVGVLDADWRTALNTAWNSLIAPATGAPFGNMHLLHDDDSSPTEITALITQLLGATQRRRLRH